jgi:hypothetical protein
MARSLYYITLRIHNLRDIDKFCTKLMSAGLDKHTSLSKQTHLPTTESIHYDCVMFYSGGIGLK